MGRRARQQVPAPVPEREGGPPAPGPPDPPPPRAPAPHRCVPSRDAGATVADAALAGGGRAYTCILFARGCCHRGGDCPFLHRAPTADDEAAAAADAARDVFGRDRACLPDDDVTGTGALVRDVKSIYLNWGVGGSAPPSWRHTLDAEARAFGPLLRTHVMSGGAPVAFIEYAWRASAEFAREALPRQRLPGLPETALPLAVRWALDDPNPVVAARLAADRAAAVVDGVRRAVGEGGAGAAKRARLAAVYGSANLRDKAVAGSRRERPAGGRPALAAPAALRDPGAWGGGGGGGEEEEDGDDDDDGDADADLGGAAAVVAAPPLPPPPPPVAADTGDPGIAEAAGWTRDAEGRWVLKEGETGGDAATAPAAAAAPDALGALAGYGSDSE